MRLSDAMKPAMEWSEAAMMPARPRTLSGGAALRQIRQTRRMDTAEVRERDAPVPAADARGARKAQLKRAAYRQVFRLF